VNLKVINIDKSFSAKVVNKKKKRGVYIENLKRETALKDRVR